MTHPSKAWNSKQTYRHLLWASCWTLLEHHHPVSKRQTNRQTNIPVVCMCLVEHCLSILILSAATTIFGMHVNKAISIRNIRIQATSFKLKLGLSISLLTAYVFHVQKLQRAPDILPLWTIQISEFSKNSTTWETFRHVRCGHLECDDIWSIEMLASAEGYGNILTNPTGR